MDGVGKVTPLYFDVGGSLAAAGPGGRRAWAAASVRSRLDRVRRVEARGIRGTDAFESSVKLSTALILSNESDGPWAAGDARYCPCFRKL